MTDSIRCAREGCGLDEEHAIHNKVTPGSLITRSFGQSVYGHAFVAPASTPEEPDGTGKARAELAERGYQRVNDPRNTQAAFKKTG